MHLVQSAAALPRTTTGLSETLRGGGTAGAVKCIAMRKMRLTHVKVRDEFTRRLPSTSTLERF